MSERCTGLDDGAKAPAIISTGKHLGGGSISWLTVLTLLLARCGCCLGTEWPGPGDGGYNGDVNPGGGGTQVDPWAVGVILRVGSNADGTLNVEAGEVLANMRERGS